MAEYGHSRKKVVFYSTDKTHAEMKIRLKEDSHGVTKRKKTKKMLADGERTKTLFGLDKQDVENIFDIIEKEHPEL